MKVIRSAVLEKKYQVPSKSEPGTYHTVEVWTNGRMICDCMAGSFGKHCSHKTIVERQRDAEFDN